MNYFTQQENNLLLKAITQHYENLQKEKIKLPRQIRELKEYHIIIEKLKLIDIIHRQENDILMLNDPNLRYK